MDNYQKFGWISGQVLMGAGFGIICSLLSVFIVHLFFGRLDLKASGFFGLVGFYIGNPIGVSYDGLKVLKKLGIENRFFKQLLQCTFGTILGIVLLYFGQMNFNLNSLPRFIGITITNLSILTFPLAGATLGFNFWLPYRRNNDDKKVH